MTLIHKRTSGVRGLHFYYVNQYEFIFNDIVPKVICAKASL